MSEIPPGPAPYAAESRIHLRWWVSLAALAALAYVGSLAHPLLYDDRTLLANSWLEREADALSVFSHDLWYGTRHAGSDLYRPLTVLCLAWNLRLAPSRIGIRSVNLLFHVLVTLLVAAMLRAVLRAYRSVPTREQPRRAGELSFVPCAGAALFAVHPLGSEAVLWAVGRAELLSAGFGLGAFALFLTDGPGRRRAWARLGGSLALFLLALLSKESAAAWLGIRLRVAGRCATDRSPALGAGARAGSELPRGLRDLPDSSGHGGGFRASPSAQGRQPSRRRGPSDTDR